MPIGLLFNKREPVQQNGLLPLFLCWAQLQISQGNHPSSHKSSNRTVLIMNLVSSSTTSFKLMLVFLTDGSRKSAGSIFHLENNAVNATAPSTKFIYSASTGGH